MGHPVCTKAVIPSCSVCFVSTSEETFHYDPSRWFCYDDSTINIVPFINIIRPTIVVVVVVVVVYIPSALLS